ANTITVQHNLGRDGNIGPTKGGRADVIDLMPQAREVLVRLKLASGGADLVFTNRDGNPRQLRDVQRGFALAVQRAGLKEGVVFHTLRHTCASKLANHPGIVLVDVRDFMRHTDLAITQGYMHSLPSESKKALLAEALALWGACTYTAGSRSIRPGCTSTPRASGVRAPCAVGSRCGSAGGGWRTPPGSRRHGRGTLEWTSRTSSFRHVAPFGALRRSSEDVRSRTARGARRQAARPASCRRRAPRRPSACRASRPRCLESGATWRRPAGCGVPPWRAGVVARDERGRRHVVARRLLQEEARAFAWFISR